MESIKEAYLRTKMNFQKRKFCILSSEKHANKIEDNLLLKYALEQDTGRTYAKKGVKILDSITIREYEWLNTIIKKIRKFNLSFYRIDYYVMGDLFKVIELECIDPDLFLKKLSFEKQSQIIRELREKILKCNNHEKRI
jgi:hypothetical protein